MKAISFEMRTLTTREKRILVLALIVGVVLLLANGLPAFMSWYQARSDAIAALQIDIEREQRLIADADVWVQRREDAEQSIRELEASLFNAGSVALLTAGIQRQVRQIAAESSLNITSANLAQSRNKDNWILVEQTLSFNTDDQNNVLMFLQRLQDTRPVLKVVGFSMRRNRNLYAGEITVVGFSQSTNAVVAAEQNR
jgi:phosphoserine phosphatase